MCILIMILSKDCLIDTNIPLKQIYIHVFTGMHVILELLTRILFTCGKDT